MNIISDEDLALTNGDARQCAYCGAVTSVDEWHHCSAQADAAAREDARFTEDYFGAGGTKTRRFVVEVSGPDTEMGQRDAWDFMSTEVLVSGGSCTGHDPVLGLSWMVTEL